MSHVVGSSCKSHRRITMHLQFYFVTVPVRQQFAENHSLVTVFTQFFFLTTTSVLLARCLDRDNEEMTGETSSNTQAKFGKWSVTVSLLPRLHSSLQQQSPIEVSCSLRCSPTLSLKHYREQLSYRREAYRLDGIRLSLSGSTLQWGAVSGASCYSCFPVFCHNE